MDVLVLDGYQQRLWNEVWREEKRNHLQWSAASHPLLTPSPTDSHRSQQSAIEKKKSQQKPTVYANQTGKNGGLFAKDGSRTNHRALKGQLRQSNEGLGAARHEICPLWWEDGNESLQIQSIRLVKHVVMTFVGDVIGCERRSAFSVDPLEIWRPTRLFRGLWLAGYIIVGLGRIAVFFHFDIQSDC